MTISPETIDQIRQSIDIVEIIREYIPTLKRSGRNWKSNCPFHNEKTPSFMVSGEKGIYHCFGCSAGGDVFKFVMQMDNLTWPEAVRKLAGRAGITIRENEEDIIRRSERQKVYDLLEQAARFYHRYLIETSEGRKAREYLAGRGVTDGTINKFLIGFAPGGYLMPSALKKGYTIEELMAAGLLTKTERGRFFEYMSGRIVFPILDTQGRVVAFGGRTLRDEQPKYLNTPETRIYTKSHHLYGLFQAIPALREKRSLIVLEGYMDVVVSHQYGVDTAVATLGTAFTETQARMVNRYADEVTLLFDPDEAGMQAARRAIETLIETELAVTVAIIPDGKDPDEYLLAGGIEAFKGMLAAERRSVMDFVTSRAIEAHGSATPEQKARAAAEVIALIDKIKNAVVRGEWTRHLAEELHVTEDALHAELRRLRRSSAARPSRPNDPPGAALPSTPVRSAEEELLQLAALHPQLRAQVDGNLFTDPRQKKVFGLLCSDVRAADIVNHLEDDEAGWFTELMLEEKNYPYPDQTIANLLRDIRNHALEEERQALRQEIVSMSGGSVPMDENKIRHYQELSRQLKGSVKP